MVAIEISEIANKIIRFSILGIIVAIGLGIIIYVSIKSLIPKGKKWKDMPQKFKFKIYRNVAFGLVIGAIIILMPFLIGKTVMDYYPILGIILVILLILQKKKINLKWGTVLISFFIPGLGQTIYAKQWWKLLIFTGSILLLEFFIPLIWFFVQPTIAVYTTVLAIVIYVINLIDAYEVGKRVQNRSTTLTK